MTKNVNLLTSIVHDKLSIPSLMMIWTCAWDKSYDNMNQERSHARTLTKIYMYINHGVSIFRKFTHLSWQNFETTIFPNPIGSYNRLLQMEMIEHQIKPFKILRRCELLSIGYILSTYILSTYILSTYILSTYILSTYILSTYIAYRGVRLYSLVSFRP